MIQLPPKITLKAARINAGLNLKEAAEKIGVSVATLHKWESDSSNIKVSDVKKIEEVYHYPNDYIFFGSELEFNSMKLIEER
ncbi:helix-turn-helix transcriptional regulator [Caldifermentibacillus hisashii]|uniref:helix-turn-helix domain-containing protein n=1 Tax=Caldifermentibacillus hisashii TaxID=996558 RepID=UPI0031FD27DA